MKRPSPNQPWNLCVCVWISAAHTVSLERQQKGYVLCLSSMPCISQFFEGVSPLTERLLSLLLPSQGFSPWVYSSYISLPQSAFWVPLICKQTSSHIFSQDLLRLSAHHCLIVSDARTRQVPPVLIHTCCVVSSSSFSTPFHPLPPNFSFYNSTYICPCLTPSSARSCIQVSTKPSTDCPLLLRRIKTNTKVLQSP